MAVADAVAVAVELEACDDGFRDTWCCVPVVLCEVLDGCPCDVALVDVVFVDFEAFEEDGFEALDEDDLLAGLLADDFEDFDEPCDEEDFEPEEEPDPEDVDEPPEPCEGEAEAVWLASNESPNHITTATPVTMTDVPATLTSPRAARANEGFTCDHSVEEETALTARRANGEHRQEPRSEKR